MLRLTVTGSPKEKTSISIAFLSSLSSNLYSLTPLSVDQFVKHKILKSWDCRDSSVNSLSHAFVINHQFS